MVVKVEVSDGLLDITLVCPVLMFVVPFLNFEILNTSNLVLVKSVFRPVLVVKEPFWIESGLTLKTEFLVLEIGLL